MHIGHELADPFGTDPNDVNLEVLQQHLNPNPIPIPNPNPNPSPNPNQVLQQQVLDDLENYVLKWQVRVRVRIRARARARVRATSRTTCSNGR